MFIETVDDPDTAPPITIGPPLTFTKDNTVLLVRIRL